MTLAYHRLDEQNIMRFHLDRVLEDAMVESSHRHAAALIASELFTNAIVHGRADEVRVEIGVRDVITLVISHPCSFVMPVPPRATMPHHHTERGRGLAIVDRLALDVHTEVVDGWHRTTAVLPRDDRSGC